MWFYTFARDTTPRYQRKQGADHFTVTTWWRGTDLYSGNLGQHTFRNVVVGFMEVGVEVVQPAVRHVFEVPYVANAITDHLSATQGLRKMYTFAFRGTRLGAWTDGADENDAATCGVGGVGVRECLYSLMPEKPTAESYPHWLTDSKIVFVEREQDKPGMSHPIDRKSQALEMARTHYCIVLHGDTLSSSRLYSAVSNDCVPVIISDGYNGAFDSWLVNWDAFTVRISEEDFSRDPAGTLNWVLTKYGLPTEPDSKGAALLAKLRKAKPDVLWHMAGSRVARNILHTAWDFVRRYSLNVRTHTWCEHVADNTKGGTLCTRRTTSGSSEAYSSSVAMVGIGVVDDVKEEEIVAPALSAAAAAEGAGTASSGTRTRAPVFIHIPKTGGTTVEMSAAAHGVMLGMCASENPPAIAEFSSCSRWHQPPLTPQATVIPDSFCIVRNPFARLLSEYNYNYRDAAMCEGFETWTNESVNALLGNKMLKCLQANPDAAACKEGDFGPPPSFLDCHLLPQTLYTSSCETVLAYERWEEDVVPWVQFVAGVSLTKETSAKSSAQAQTSKKPDVSCWKQMDPAIVQKVLQAYASDFKTFGYHHAVSGVELPPTWGFVKHVQERIHKWKTRGRFGASPNLTGKDQAQSCINHNLEGKWTIYANQYIHAVAGS